MPTTMEVQDLTAYYGAVPAVAGVSLGFRPNSVTALIGPSGCGKSTFLRALNRMHELLQGARVDGRVLLDGQDIYAPGVDPAVLRRRVGMVFQKPNPFPALSIRENVLAGVRLDRTVTEDDAAAVAEDSLRRVNLWAEVEHRLGDAAAVLSGGQQQRLCIARAIAVGPEVLLMDEPCSALDPGSTAAIEELIARLKRDYLIVIVTHDLAQARRVSDATAYFNRPDAGAPGRLIEYADTPTIFSRPGRQSTADYLSGH